MRGNKLVVSIMVGGLLAVSTIAVSGEREGGGNWEAPDSESEQPSDQNGEEGSNDNAPTTSDDAIATDMSSQDQSEEEGVEPRPQHCEVLEDHATLGKYLAKNECRPYEIRIYKDRPSGLYGFLCGDLYTKIDFDSDVLPHVAGADGCVEMKADKIKETLYFCFSKGRYSTVNW